MNLENLTIWVREQSGLRDLELKPLYGDLSRRRYFRAQVNDKSWIIADSSAEITDLPAFTAIDRALAKLGLLTPEIISDDSSAGLLILQDFGDQTLLRTLSSDNVEHWYQKAFHDLVCMQSCRVVDQYPIPNYDRNAITREFGIFINWYLAKYHHIDLQQHASLLENTLQILLKNMLEQPLVFVHRDYHSRNLMIVDNTQLGIIDFQGAKWGPMTYDLVSLIKDCYIDWPREMVYRWVGEMQPRLWKSLTIPPVSAELFMRWFDLTGLQRHLKAMGQFTRKFLIDNSQYYLVDLPRVERYVLDVCAQYPELKELHQLLTELTCAP